MNKLSSILRARSSIKNSKLVRLLSTDADEKIEIPKRIARGPTDILRALESTISRDTTAAHYKYHDDPFLIPMSNTGKRVFAMAQESGRKAAQWVRAQHSDLFQHMESDPPITAFFPKVVYDENSNVTEQDLKQVINDVLVSDAILVYKLCKEKGVEISAETELSLLELLCYSNSTDVMSDELIEEKWFKQTTSTKEKMRKTWKDGSIAEEIFISIENPRSQAYSALIQGMAKHYQVDRAWQLFEEAREKQIPLSVGAYNKIISVSNFLKEEYEIRWNFVVDLLNSMAKAKVQPNLGTLNAVLEIMSVMGLSKQTRDRVLQVLAEFKQLGIEPSLASWYFILITYCKERGPTSPILRDILQEIENTEHKIQDIRDTYFFVTAMDVCRNHLFDKELGKRVHHLLLYGNNYNLIGDSYKESIYYRHYVSLLCATEPLDEFMEYTYNVLIPHVYVPEPGVMGEILKSVESNRAIEYLPKLWSDMIVFDHTNREKLITHILKIMVENEPLEDNLELNEKFANVAWDIYDRIEGQSEHRTVQLTFTGEMLGNILTVLLRNNNFDKATEVMGRLIDGQRVIGVSKIEALSLYVDHCILQKVPSEATNCIQYCADNGFEETGSLAAKLDAELTLDEDHLRKLGKIIGQNLESKESNKPTDSI